MDYKHIAPYQWLKYWVIPGQKGGEGRVLPRTHRSTNRNKHKLSWYTVKGVVAQSSNLSTCHWGILVGFPESQFLFFEMEMVVATSGITGMEYA